MLYRDQLLRLGGYVAFAVMNGKPKFGVGQNKNQNALNAFNETKTKYL